LKIGIIADTHDNLPRITAAVELLRSEGAEVLVHAGDFIAPFSVKELLKFPGEVYGVFGNNDGEKAGILKIWDRVYHGPYLLELGGLRILLAHEEGALSRAPHDNIDVRIFGHSHKAEIREGRPLDINPGTAAGILAGRATCAILESEGPSARIMEIT
jgi:putative phosphoesterase